jgi:LDH2 family malate/lactate/ureidoglycolate dehydrogenase
VRHKRAFVNFVIVKSSRHVSAIGYYCQEVVEERLTKHFLRV